MSAQVGRPRRKDSPVKATYYLSGNAREHARKLAFDDDRSESSFIQSLINEAWEKAEALKLKKKKVRQELTAKAA